ncbi:MAG TPA: DNA recombination protein RmuC [Trebonia sp.]|jgi:DNA recombination protein RmuC|nr:DNA recombination protein RmuC [Trebonia sp.]
MIVFALLAGIAIGAALGYLLMRGRVATAQERARAAGEKYALLERTAQAQAALVEGQLGERLDVGQLVGPIRETLARVERQLRETDQARTRSHAELAEQVEFTRRGAEQLREQAAALVTALRRPEARGRWGELQLRRVVELAGMTARCDFDEQVTIRGAADGQGQRPDMVVNLAGGKHVVVDSKVSLAAYLEAVEVADPVLQEARLEAHARHLRTHVDQLGGKAYWAALPSTPEFVILFIPGEAFLAPALERDPALLEYAIARRVHIATPTTLVSMLRTAHFAWQQEALSENARAVFDLGRELYERLASLGRHVDKLGRSLNGAVVAYNQAVGSLEGRVLVTARKLSDLGVVAGELPTPLPAQETTRPLSAPELVADDVAPGRSAPEDRAELAESLPY